MSKKDDKQETHVVYGLAFGMMAGSVGMGLCVMLGQAAYGGLCVALGVLIGVVVGVCIKKKP